MPQVKSDTTLHDATRHLPMTGPSSPALPVDRRRFEVAAGGHRLCAEWLEPRSARAGGAVPLVFLHEGLGSIAQWTGNGRGLGPVDVPAYMVGETGCPALVYERAGFGGSAPLTDQRQPDYLYREAWQALPQVLDQVGIDRSILVGHSDGGSIALLFAARNPERVVALVAEAAHVIVEDVTLAGIREARAAYHAADGRLRSALGRFHGEKTDSTFSGWADVWLDPAFAAFDMREALPGVACPSLIIQGAEDEYGTPAQVEAIAAGVAGPCETWIVPRCRHVPHFQAAEHVLPRIATFIREANSRP